MNFFRNPIIQEYVYQTCAELMWEVEIDEAFDEPGFHACIKTSNSRFCLIDGDECGDNATYSPSKITFLEFHGKNHGRIGNELTIDLYDPKNDLASALKEWDLKIRGLNT